MDLYAEYDALEFDSKSAFLDDRLSLYAFLINNGHEDYQAEDQFKLYLDELLVQSKTDNYYWLFCPFMIYQNHFPKKLNDYLSANSGKDAITFIEKCKAKILLHYEPQFKESYLSGEDFIVSNENIKYVYFDGTGLSDGKHQPVYVDLSFLDNMTKQLLCYNEKQKLDFLESEFRKLGTPPQNPYPKIFVDAKSFDLFKSLLQNIGKKHADISFIYRIMYADEFIHQASEGVFRAWLKKEMHISHGDNKIQQLYRSETDLKKGLYLQILSQFQLKSKSYS